MLCCEERDQAFRDTLVEESVSGFVMGMCTARCFERLMGFIDLDILSVDNLQTLSADPFKVAVPVCLLSPADDMDLAIYSSFVSSQEETEKH